MESNLTSICLGLSCDLKLEDGNSCLSEGFKSQLGTTKRCIITIITTKICYKNHLKYAQQYFKEGV